MTQGCWCKCANTLHSVSGKGFPFDELVSDAFIGQLPSSYNDFSCNGLNCMEFSDCQREGSTIIAQYYNLYNKDLEPEFNPAKSMHVGILEVL